MRLFLLCLPFLSLSSLAMQEACKKFMIDNKPLYFSAHRASSSEIKLCIQYENLTLIQTQKRNARGQVAVSYQGSMEITLGYDESLAPAHVKKTFNELYRKILPEESNLP